MTDCEDPSHNNSCPECGCPAFVDEEEGHVDCSNIGCDYYGGGDYDFDSGASDGDDDDYANTDDEDGPW